MTTAAGVALVLPDTLNAVELTNEGPDDVRFTTDGSTPTAARGNDLGVGATRMLKGVYWANIRLIRTLITNVKVNVRVGRVVKGD